MNIFSAAWQSLKTWNMTRYLVALAASVVIALIIGIATVLIPNPIFARDIPPVWWNYPVWLLTSLFSGMLLVTYLKVGRKDEAAAASEQMLEDTKGGKMGMAGGILAWFAVGCPVCNKLALIALGYTGALTWFAPIQPYLAITALILTAVALLIRLRGETLCVMPTKKRATVQVQP